MKLRYILLLLFLPFTLVLSAQENDTTTLPSHSNIGVINREAIVRLLPEAQRAEQAIEKSRLEYETEYHRMENDYNEKVRYYVENNKTMSDPLRLARQTEITELEKRMVLFHDRYMEELRLRRERAFAPLYVRVDAAIRLAANNNGIDVVLNPESVVFLSSRVVDLNPLVKQILSIGDND